MYVDRHPGVLNLDIDRVRGLIGGWLDRFDETGEIVRPIARSMASTHLRGGYDVIMPQYLGQAGEIEKFQRLAVDSGGVFVEVMLMDTKQRSVERFARRGDDDSDAWHRQVQRIVDDNGGVTLLAAMHDELTDLLRTRPDVIVIPSTAGATQQAYQDLAAVLDSPSQRD